MGKDWKSDSSSDIETASLTLSPDSSWGSAEENAEQQQPLIEFLLSSPIRHRRLYPDDEDESYHADDDDDDDDSIEKRRKHDTIHHRKRYLWLVFPVLLVLTFTKLALRPRWVLPHNHSYKLQRILTTLRSTPVTPQVTIRLQGEFLHRMVASIDRHAPCHAVHQVQVDPELLKVLHHAKLVADTAPVETDGILMLDEAMELSCDQIEQMMQLWQQDVVRPVGVSAHATALASDRALLVHRFWTHQVPELPEADCSEYSLSAWTRALGAPAPHLVFSSHVEAAPSHCVAAARRALGVWSLSETTVLINAAE